MLQSIVLVFKMVQKSKKYSRTGKRRGSSEQPQQLKLDGFPSELNEKPTRKSKQIIINSLDAVTKYDEMVLTVEFELVPSKIVFSKVRSTLWFDDQEIKSDLIGIPQGFGSSDEFQLNYKLDMKGIKAGKHIIKTELHDLFSSCFAIEEKPIDYVPLDRKAAYRKIPTVKKNAGEDFTVVSNMEKEIYRDMEKASKSEFDSKRDKW